MRLLLALIVFIAGFVSPLFAQKAASPCRDIVYLKDGSVLRGKIDHYHLDSTLMMTTWSGMQLTVSSVQVKKVVQRCSDEHRAVFSPMAREYRFRDKAWYNLTRFSALPGASNLGFGVQNSTGYRWNRWLSAGVGTGIENFVLDGNNGACIPIFAEWRAYLLPQNLSPFVSCGVGYGIQGKRREEVVWSDQNENWHGGWLAQGQVGFRTGNHFLLHIGIRMQHVVREWDYIWSDTRGKDKLLYKRLDVGFALML